MGYLGKIGSLLMSAGKPLAKAAITPNAAKQLYGNLIGTSKSGVQVFRHVARDVVTTTSFKNGKMFKQIQQFSRTGNDAKTIVKNLSKENITNILHTFKSGDIVRTLHKYTSALGERLSLGTINDVSVKVYKNGLSSLRFKSTDNEMNGYLINILRKGKNIITKDLKFLNSGKSQTVATDPLNFLL